MNGRKAKQLKLLAKTIYNIQPIKVKSIDQIYNDLKSIKNVKTGNATKVTK